ncbi:MAG: hypothetical protein JSV42_02505 [Chloroflexota bacterium]|nr:MAG: hypothetical protein JSV42_02505 [Chloroflexota bacterium]
MRINLARALIGVVVIFNLQAAAVFLVWPEQYTASFELQGVVGEAMLRGLGVLFVMWNVPYVVAMLQPIRNRISLYEALAMQVIGLIGEALIFFSLPGTHTLLQASITRFIIFDALGLSLLICATLLVRNQ